MSFILHSHHDRYNQRARASLLRSFAVGLSFLAALFLGYAAAQKRDEQTLRHVREQNTELLQDSEKTQAQLTNLQADLQTQIVKFQQLENQYNRDVPQGDLGLMTALIKEQLDKGLAVDRMIQIIRMAQPPQNCAQAINKRVILSTPAYKGPESAVTFAEGAIAVKGQGTPSNNSNQEKEAWFDPGKPVTITFTVIGGKSEEKTGLLPINHTIIWRDKEYRFTISEGPRSFVVISSDNCDYMKSVIDASRPPK